MSATLSRETWFSLGVLLPFETYYTLFMPLLSSSARITAHSSRSLHLSLADVPTSHFRPARQTRCNSDKMHATEQRKLELSKVLGPCSHIWGAPPPLPLGHSFKG